MAGIYIHIPFCKKACNYCNFHFSTSLSNKTPLLEALNKELELRKNFFDKNEVVETIYFGGGTPSLLSEKELETILNQIHKFYDVSSNAEITLEANPDDISKEKLKALSVSGINRLSIGVQSFYDDILKWMNRAHSVSQSKRAVFEAQQAGFDNITIDLIYGFPMLTHEYWKNTLEQTQQLNIQHISAYQLTLEKGTALYHDFTHKKFYPSEDDFVAEQFEMLIHFASKNGFEHYEISNFAKPGYISQHNSSYWLGKPYLGIGPSAHSYKLSHRSWNIANNAKYIHCINNHLSFSEEEFINEKTRNNEYILTRLRTNWGMNLDFFNEKDQAAIMNEAEKYLQTKRLKLENNHLFLTEKGVMIADRISSDLFF